MNLTDTETDVFGVRTYKFQMQVAEFRLSHIMTPPETGMLHQNLCRQRY